MNYRLLADTVLVIHFVFILYIIFGGLLALKWKKTTWLHLPLLLWGVLIEYFGWICPLTPLENSFRHKGGGKGYNNSYLENYLLPLVYPGELTEEVRLFLGTLLLLFNIFIYSLVRYRWKDRNN